MSYLIALLLIVIPLINIFYYKDRLFNFVVLIAYIVLAFKLIKFNSIVLIIGMVIGFILFCVGFRKRLKRA